MLLSQHAPWCKVWLRPAHSSSRRDAHDCRTQRRHRLGDFQVRAADGSLNSIDKYFRSRSEVSVTVDFELRGDTHGDVAARVGEHEPKAACSGE
jgi:hypothetical protein